MSVRIESALARPDLADQADEATASAFPEYNTHGDVAGPRWSRLYEEYPAYQLVLWDDATGEALGEANTIPCRFDGTLQGLPRSIDEVLATGLPEVGVAPAPTALCALAIAIPSGQENRGQSRLLLEGMRALAAGHGWAQLVAPVRPNWKARYPLTPIQRYAAWMRPDGLPFDPWLRVHARLGGRILRAEPESLRISGTVEEWRGGLGWPSRSPGGMCFPRGWPCCTSTVSGMSGCTTSPTSGSRTTRSRRAGQAEPIRAATAGLKRGLSKGRGHGRELPHLPQARDLSLRAWPHQHPRSNALYDRCATETGVRDVSPNGQPTCWSDSHEAAERVRLRSTPCQSMGSWLSPRGWAAFPLLRGRMVGLGGVEPPTSPYQ
jgi:hypothetical protein